MEAEKSAPDRAALLARKVAYALATFGITGLTGIAVMAIVDGVLRAFFGAPIDGVGEVSKLVVLVSLSSFFPLVLMERQNISIQFLGNYLGGRARAGLEVFGAILTLVFFAVLAWRIGYQALDTLSGGETTWMLGWPVAPWWAAASLLVFLCLPIQFVVLWCLMRGGAALGHSPGPES